MPTESPSVSRPVLWIGVTLVILVGFVALPALIWVLPFRWLNWSRWILIPMCTLGTVGYFLATWQALQWVARGAREAQPDLQLVGEPSAAAQPQQTSETVKGVYEEILATEEDPEVREVVQEALDRVEVKRR